MEAKYYTPQIEEFHVGFEYEYKCDKYMGFLDDTKNQWNKTTFTASFQQDLGSEINDVEELIESENIRVKHLDREDIKSEGWELFLAEKDLNPYFRTKDKKYTLVFWEILSESQEIGNVYIRQEFGLGQKSFKGNILNKSELRKIMKMLNIQGK